MSLHITRIFIPLRTEAGVPIINISAAWGGGSGVFGIFFDFFGPGPLKNASEKIALRSFCPDFRAEISHGEPNRARDNFPKK